MISFEKNSEKANYENEKSRGRAKKDGQQRWRSLGPSEEDLKILILRKNRG
jgi:hypothetical protein